MRAAKVMGAGLPGGTSFMEDYTYDLDPGRRAHPRRAHARGLPQPHRRPARRCEIHPLAIGGREDPVRLVFTADPGPGVVVALSDMGDRFRLVANEVEVVPPTAPLPKLPVGRAVWKPAPDFATSADRLAARPARPTTPCMSTAVGIEAFEDFARIAGTELLVIDETTTVRAFEQRTALERRLLPARPRHLTSAGPVTSWSVRETSKDFSRTDRCFASTATSRCARGIDRPLASPWAHILRARFRRKALRRVNVTIRTHALDALDGADFSQCDRSHVTVHIIRDKVNSLKAIGM